jgi:hypothetical protein
MRSSRMDYTQVRYPVLKERYENEPNNMPKCLYANRASRSYRYYCVVDVNIDAFT